MVDFDVILGMDLLSPNHTIIYYHANTMALAMARLPRIEWRGALGHVPSSVVSVSKGTTDC